MAAAALLSITLAPILMGFFIRGKIPPEEKNPINRFLIWLYHPVIDFVIQLALGCGLHRGRPSWSLGLFAVELRWWRSVLPEGKAKDWAAQIGKFFPYQNLGSEFMPPLYEGDLLYMPTTFPGISPTKAREILQAHRQNHQNISRKSNTSSAKSAAPKPRLTPRRWT